MTLSVNQKGIFYIYATIVFVLMCVSNRVMYTNHFPHSLLLPLSSIQLFFFFILSDNIKSSVVAAMVFCLGVISCMLFFKHPENTVLRAIISAGNFATLSSVLLLSPKDKKVLLEFISNIMAVLLLISLTGWGLHMIGFTIPVFEYVDLKDDMHFLNNHYIYYANADTLSEFFPRFRGFFIEPGQLATPCLFLFFARGAHIWEKKNIILLLAILLSFSLVGYVALLVGLFLKYLFTEQNFKIARILGFILIIGSIAFYSARSASEDNPLFSLIMERLEYDEELGISGNNRTDTDFDNHYNQYVHSEKIIFGMGDEIKTGYGSWTNHASGIKKFFVNFGIIGVLTMILLTLLLLKHNYCRSTLVFSCVIWMAFLVRDMLQTQFWLIIAILGFYNLKMLSNFDARKKLPAKS